MSQAVVIDFHTEAPEADAPALRRMRLVSRGLEMLFLALAIGWCLLATPLILAFVIPYAGNLISLGPSGGLLTFGPHPLPHGFITPGQMPLIQRLAQVPVGLLNAAPTFILFWSLHRLFGAYAKGVVFTPQNARRIKHIGAALAVSAVAPFLGFTFLNSLGLAIDHNWMHGTSLQELVLGAVVYVIAQVMQIGRELEDEQRQFV